MPWRPSLATATPQLLLLLLLQLIRACCSLTCMTCRLTADSTQLDRFRVTTRLSRPFCNWEPIRCDRDQDICVTVTMHIGGGEYWLGAGCDSRINFPQGSASQSCENVRTLAKTNHYGYVHERKALQRVCVCSRDQCNSSFSLLSALLPLFLLLRWFFL